ncbi:MAG: hypothetical protein ACTSWG_07625 [Candidatus Helarchaeota archaeon]
MKRKKLTIIVFLSSFFLINLVMTIINLNLLKADIPIICDWPQEGQGRCFIHDFPYHPENCIWDGRTVVYCSPW